MDLLIELRKSELEQRNKEISDAAIEILLSDQNEESKVLEQLGNPSVDFAQSSLEESWTPEFFSASVIKEICVKYRLRYLDVKRFKGEIPYSAIQRIKSLERRVDLNVSAYKIIAPAERFTLSDSTKDPLLFAVTDNGEHVLIEKWGEEMSDLRKWASYPFANMQNMVISIALVALLISLVFPTGLLSSEPQTLARIYLQKSMMFFTLSGLLFGAAIIAGIIKGEDFSEDVWDDPYFN